MKYEDSKLSCGAVGFFTVNILTTRLVGGCVRVFPVMTGSGAHLAAAVAGAAAILIAVLLCRLHCNGDLLDYAERRFGAAGRCAVAGFLFLYIMLSASSSLRDFADLAMRVSFPNTPLWFVLLTLAAAMFIGGTSGLNTLGRLCGFIVPMTFAATVLMLSAAVGGADIDNLFPVFGTGAASVAKSSFSGLTLYSDLALLFLIFPRPEQKKGFNCAICIGTAVAAILNFAFVAVFVSCVPYPMSAEIENPMFVLMKEVYFGRFIRSADAVYMGIAALGEMLYLSFMVYEMTDMLNYGFGIRNRKGFALPCALIVFLLALGTVQKFGTMMILGVGIGALVFETVLLAISERRKSHEKN